MTNRGNVFFLQHQHEQDYMITITWIVNWFCCNFQIEVWFPLQTYLTQKSRKWKWFFSRKSFISECIPILICLFKDLKKWQNDVMRDCDLQGKEGQESALRWNIMDWSAQNPSSALHCTVLYCTVLHCTVLYVALDLVKLKYSLTL